VIETIQYFYEHSSRGQGRSLASVTRSSSLRQSWSVSSRRSFWTRRSGRQGLRSDIGSRCACVWIKEMCLGRILVKEKNLRKDSWSKQELL